MKFQLTELKKCEECEYRRDSAGNDGNLSDGDIIRCFHPDGSSERLVTIAEKMSACSTCGSEHKKLVDEKTYLGDFPDWCPQMDYSNLISKVLNIPAFEGGSVWCADFEDGSRWEADNDINKITVIIDIYKNLNPISRQILLTKLIEN